MQTAGSVILGLTLLAFPAHGSPAQSDTAVIETTIKACVKVARQTKPEFDAYYNRGTSLVEDDIPQTMLNYDAPLWEKAYYNFRKCMAEQGVPMGPR